MHTFTNTFNILALSTLTHMLAYKKINNKSTPTMNPLFKSPQRSYLVRTTSLESTSDIPSNKRIDKMDGATYNVSTLRPIPSG